MDVNITYLIMEVMVNRDIESSSPVDSMHVGLEVGSVSVPVIISVCDKEESMDHLVQKSFNEIFSWPKLEKWLT